MEPELLASYKSAEGIARNRARNFYYSFMVLPSRKKLAFYAVYAFMRYCDDISDGQAGVEAKRTMLGEWRKQLDAVFSDSALENSILPAFRDAVNHFSIPAEYFHWIIDGAEMDLDVFQYESFQDLYTYCFNVASAVGLVCLQIFGFSGNSAKKYAEQCGIAFQLTNILRDVKEDAEMGRIYLPAEDLKKFDYSPEELRRGIIDERFIKLMEFEAARAREYYVQARKLIPLVEDASRPALWAMIEIYERILNRIIQKRFNVFHHSIRLPKTEKLFIALKALAMRLFHSAELGTEGDKLKSEGKEPS
jgi:15-cis-phytoene synthase